jgi:lipopolysaccharide biosynthesis glycosyltransferase
MHSSSKAKQDTIRIAFGVDGAYVPHAAATVASLVAASPASLMHFSVLHTGVTEEDRRRLATCAPAARFDWYDVDDPALLAVKQRAHISAASYYRLALPRLLPLDVDRILYLDTDVIVLRDIAELWRSDMRGHVVAAVDDPGVSPREFAARWSLPVPPNGYFNAGVLLVDLAAVRRKGVFDTALDFLMANQDLLPFMDQDALNYALWNQWHRLDPAWNVQRTTAITSETLQDVRPRPKRCRPAIVHYTTEHKPWLPNTFTPYAWLYWRYLKRTPFLKEVERSSGVNRRARWRLFARYVKHDLLPAHSRT